MKASDWLFLGLAGYGVYWVYNNILKPPPGGAVDTIETKIANAIANATMPSQVSVSDTGLQVQFPDGSTLPAGNVITGPMTWNNGVPSFSYNGSTWTLAPQVNGVYQATQLSGLGSYISNRARARRASLGDVENDPYFLRRI